jgi:hypothetical protein
MAVAQVPKPSEMPHHIDAKHLPNAIQVTSTLISGGLPEGKLAFVELEKLNVKTIISVDSAKPDIALARQYNMHYVHLPQGYDGISEQRGRELAKALLELEGPIYLHCHHGKHRSPAASAVACIASGCMSNEQGRTLLTLAGTGANYLGLWQSVAKSSSVPHSELKMLEVAFPEVAVIPPMAKAMVDLNLAYERIKKLQASGWKAEGLQVETACSQLLLLREHFTELKRLEETKRYPVDFAEHLKVSEKAGERLLQHFQFQSDAIAWPDPKTIGTLNTEFSTVSVSCTNCHRSYRDGSNSQ